MKEEELKDLEKTLWDSAEKMRSSVSVSNYKFIVLGLIFLKYISDSFEERYEELVNENEGMEEDRDSYTMKNIFFVPKNARWDYLVAHSKDPEIGKIIDDSLEAIEKENPSLKGVLIKQYNSPDYRNVNLGELIDLFTNIKVGTKEAQDKDILGRIYEYFLGQFAASELVKGGEYYTPACLVRTMVEIIEPFKGRVYDPACGSGGMFVQSLKFIQNHQGNTRDVSIYGQEVNPTTWKLAKMNMAIRSINADLGKFADSTFTNDLHKDLKADFALANPPFNMSDWGYEQLKNDSRWKYGLPPKNNANYAWLEHIISKLSINGKAAVILANGSLSSETGGEGKIRKNLIEADLVDCILSMPTNLFYTVTVPCSIWIINRNKKQKGKTLFIDARNKGTMVTRKLREFSDEEILGIAGTYHKYQNSDNYEDIAGYCKSATLDEIRENNYILTPGRYVGTPPEEDDGIPFEEKVKILTSELSEQMKESQKLDEEIKDILGKLGYGI